MNRISKGFTVIELMIIVAILACGVAILMPFFAGSSNNSISYGVNGVVETRCVEGFKVMITNRGRYGSGIQQMIDQDGHAIPCTKPKPENNQ